MTPSRITQQVASLLSRLVEERTGLYFNDLDLFVDKLSRRAAVAGYQSGLDYYYFLRYDPASAAELDALINALVVGETYLFRELEPLRILAEHVLAPAIAASLRPRVWSAACATGEEPLTLAMLLAEPFLAGHLEIVATDISQAAIDRARRGELGRRALRGPCPPPYERWIEAGPGDATRVRRDLVDAITWRRVNLVRHGEILALGRFDAIICRNVLIYFSDDTARRVIASLNDVLAPGGLLLVGASESLLRFGTLLTCEERGGSFFYRKRVP